MARRSLTDVGILRSPLRTEVPKSEVYVTISRQARSGVSSIAGSGTSQVHAQEPGFLGLGFLAGHWPYPQSS